MNLERLARLLWAAQGVTRSDGGRAAPSAGGLYPLTLYVAAGHVTGLPAGIYRYAAAEHTLRLVRSGDARAEIAAAAYGQDWIADSPAVALIAADYGRTAARYGDRARRYVDVEAGHAAQNLCLEAVALALGAAVVGAFDDAELGLAARLPKRQAPVLLVPVGQPG
jgi:SagB-type dehydrogenase family enzyme